MSKDAPLYPRLLRLRHIEPSAWQRALLGEGVLGAAALLVLADVASAWALLVLPVAVAGVVKGHDLLAGVLSGAPGVPPTGARRAGAGGSAGGSAALRSAVLRERQDGPDAGSTASPGRFTRRGLRRRADDS